MLRDESSTQRLIVKELQPFEVVRGPCGPRISILGLIGHYYPKHTFFKAHGLIDYMEFACTP